MVEGGYREPSRALVQEFREGGGCRVGAQSEPRKIQQFIIHEGGATPTELREL